MDFAVGIRSDSGCHSAFYIWDFSSYKIRRVCRSTLGTEANALLEATEYADCCRQVIFSLLLSGIPLNVLAFLDFPVR
eukprot:3248656-Amphidinium_carterae.2